MPATTPSEPADGFTVHVDPDDLELQQLGAPARPATSRRGTPGRRTAIPDRRDAAARTAARTATARATRAYPFRRS